MDATQNSRNKQNDQELQDMVSNDGMTAESARKTKDDAESTTHADHYVQNEKPGAKFNINDQAHSQSSKEDFFKTVSNFKHDDGTTPPAAIDSEHLDTD